MNTIQTTRGNINVQSPNKIIFQRLQNVLTFGIMPLKQPFNGADFGLVMQCGEKDVYCVKQQPIEVERTQAEKLFQLQHYIIMKAYCRYMKLGFSGAYLASPYMRQRDNELWEAGVAHFIFPAEKELQNTDVASNKTYDRPFGKGATTMYMEFVHCFKKAFHDEKMAMPQYIGMDVRPRSHVQSLGMYFMVAGKDIFCLRANQREQHDVAWNVLSDARIGMVYHLPSIPMTINDADLITTKGRI